MINVRDLTNTGEVLTATELLERERRLEEEAEAKLQENWGDENACTYEQGYISQPIYSCRTCVARGKQDTFGFCFGCSMNCHVEHDVVELFDKRHFKCDCGTPKSGCACKFAETARLQNNEENKYTHNFDGKYCWCDSAYDPDTDIMSQCVVCEDWFHHTCVERRTKIPDLASFKGFVCHECLAKNPFFLRYPQLQPSSENTTASTTETNNTDTKKESTADTTNSNTTTTTTTTTTTSTNTENNNNEKKEETSEKEDTKPTETNTDPTQCILEQHPAPPTPNPYPDLFLIAGWRKGLCKCTNCAAMYTASNLEFLLEDFVEEPDDEEDEEQLNAEESVEAPEGGGRKRKFNLGENAEQAFLTNSQIPHSNKLGLITGLNDMKDELMAYLRQFAETGKVVTEADVAVFFEELRKKRQRL